MRPGYGQWRRNEELDGVTIERLRHYVPQRPKGIPRALSEASFGARLSTRRWGNTEAIVLVSPALISSIFGMVRAKLTQRRTPVVVWVQDLYTLGMVETGQSSGLAVKVMSAIEGWLLRSADRVVVIHDRFAARVSADFGVPAERIEVLRNWTHLPPAPPVDVAAARSRFGWAPGETVVLHAGNMGVKQGLDNVIEAARLAQRRNDPVRFVLLGNGSERDRLQSEGSGIPTLQFLPTLDDAQFAEALGSADALLVNELAGVAEMAVPSKLTSYFSAGRPVIAATDAGGITAEEIRAADAGIVVPAADPAALVDAAIRLRGDSALVERLGRNGRSYRMSVLDEETAVTSFTQMLSRLIFPARRTAPSATPTLETSSTK